MSNGPGDGAAVQSVDRALTILKLLARDGELGVSELAASLGVHRSTAFRLVATLESHDLVEQDSDRGRYRLGVGLVRLAGATSARLDLVRESRAVTPALARAVGETVNVAVLAGREALYVDQVAGPSALQLHNWVGQRIPLHATSNGKVLLAHAPGELCEEVLAADLPGLTARTVTDPRRLRAELAEVRRRGYATAVDELEDGLSAVAAPVRGADGSVIASVSASGPTFRMPETAITAVAEQVMAAAAEISARMGWFGSAL
ncbi:IclR family transcriptional regulator [Microbispora rosea subsp. aerata]|nr:IclR family transcriptional regulator [Microbispora rosea]GGO14978.1 IclR family transcriptional regulator [Microbispora rosea subsp. aerata]GIH55631.1 IclR family transcriptional regulator [Microbispora rosea subsp. aerata]GLJ86526.1 IclR family transcriptional regulator [Microbispora rosea subsp. aerata]